ncbi:MAG: hypothetical protein LQ350_007900 [Teloschistes chrysophthalmus]|nr:MAG: hypothetical protein LQ350_007900 [Niorma chrysophthalma]
MIQAPMPPPPPLPPHPHHPAMSPGVQALPAEFERLHFGSSPPPHLGHQQAHGSRVDDLGHHHRQFDTGLLKKEKDQYEGYSYEKVTPQLPNEKASWSVVTKTKMPLSQAELLAMVNKQKRKGSAAFTLLMGKEMKGYKRQQVEKLIEDRAHADQRFEFKLSGLKLDQQTDRSGNRDTSAFQVILKRQLRKDLTNDGLPALGKLREPHREVVDLTRMSDDPSEGSSQDYHHGSSPPPLRFGSAPFEGFMDQHRFEPPPHQMPFGHSPAPLMHDIHGAHQVPSPHHTPPVGNPFIHHDPRQAHPPPPFHPHMPSPPPTHHPHVPSPPPPHHAHAEKLEGNAKKPKEANSKKEWKHPKPVVHQEKIHKTHRHRKAASESDWDIISESSDSSRAYTDRTPNTNSSGNSARKDRDHHRGTNSRRSSRSHHDEYANGNNERHEEVYRVHRRKPTVSPDRPRRCSRPHYTVEEFDVIPASNTRAHRPYPIRSRTTAHRPERWPEPVERPAFHSRHMSYDDDRSYEHRGLTPPGRRGSVYAPKPPLALDTYEAREEQERWDRLDRIDRGRDLLREERRREEIREALARELEREAEEARRRERTLGRDVFYDEPSRPRRFSRGYDHDRFPF